MSNLTYMLLMMTLIGLSFHKTFSQSSDAFDSSVQKLKAAEESNYTQILDKIFEEYQELGFDTAKIHIEALLEVAEKLPFKNAIPYIHRMMGHLHNDYRLNADAFAYYEEALKLSQKYNLPYEEAQTKLSMGTLMSQQFKVNEAVTYYLEAADLFNEHGYLTEAHEINLRLGNIYYSGQNFYRAIDYYKAVFYKSSQPSSLNDKMLSANNLGLSYSQLQQADSALWYYEKGLEIAYALPDSFYIGLVSGNAGIIYAKKGEVEKAIEFLQRDIRLSKKYEEWSSAAGAMISLAITYQKTEEFEMANAYLDSAMLIAEKLNSILLKVNIYEVYITKYKREENYQKAFEYLSLVKQLRDTLQHQRQSQRAAEIDAAYNFDKNLAEIEFLKKNNKSQSLIIIVFGISTALLLVFSLLLGKLIRQRTHANRILALQKQDIEQHNTTLEAQKDKILQQNEALGSANRQISVLNEKLNQKVRFSEQILRSAYENANEAFFILRAVRELENLKYFVCLDVNHAATRLLNRPKDEIVGESLFSLLPFLAANGYFDTLRKVYAENMDFEQDVYLGQGNSFPAWMQVMANPIEGGIAVKVKNITPRKEQEQQLKEREASISAMINNTTDLILSVDPDFRLTEFNEPFVKATEIFFGFAPIHGQLVFDVIQERNIKSARNNFAQAMNGIGLEDHYEILAPDGNIVYVEAFFSPVMLDKQPIGATVVIRNITDRKKDEIKLKEALNRVQESENFLNEIIENLPVGLEIYDEQGDLIRMNEAQMELLGMTEVMLKQINVLKEPFYEAYGIDRFFAQAYQGNTVLNQEVLIDKGNPSEEWEAFNQKTWLSISAIPVKNKSGVVKSVIGLCSDITERKVAEVALSESEERLRTVINNIPIILWTTDKDGIFTMSEGKALEKMSLYPGQIVGISIFDFFTDHKEPLYVLKDAIEKGINYEDIERIGKTIFNSKVFPLRNDQGEITGMIGMSIDVTERVENEEKLKRSEANLNAIINNTNYSIWSVDTEFRVIAVNNIFREALKAAFGVELEIGENALQYISEEQAQLWSASYQKTLQGARHTFEYLYIDRFYDVSMYPIINDEQITGVAVFSLDVTEKKRTEEKLKQQQQKIIETNKVIAEYKLMALRSVMNPHFLFNSLNSIQYFIAKNERELALNYLSLFSKLIRGVLNSSVNASIALSQELDILKYYVELETLRFENKFETEFVLGEDIDLDNIEIPSLLIQPYVENAIIHGLYNKDGYGKLTISLNRQNDVLKCVVEDNGVGRKEALRIKKRNAIRHNSVGMMVTKERLDIINKTNDVSVKIYDLQNKAAQPRGTRVEIFVHI